METVGLTFTWEKGRGPFGKMLRDRICIFKASGRIDPGHKLELMLKLYDQPDPHEGALYEQTRKVFSEAEESDWTLDELVAHILQHLVVSTYDDTIVHFIKRRVFFLGPVKFEFYLELDGESVDIDEYWSIYFRLSLPDAEGKQQILRNDIIFSKSYPMIFELPEWKEPIPGLEEAVQLAIRQTLAPLDLARKGNLLDYVSEAFGRDWSNYQNLDYEALLMYLALHAWKYRLKPCSEAQIAEIRTRLGTPIPLYYERFLRVVGLSNRLHEDLLTKVEDFEKVGRNEGSFVFARSGSSDFFLSVNGDAGAFISEEWTTENTYGDSAYSIFITFREYLIKSLDEFEA